jgi:hypothetical protein
MRKQIVRIVSIDKRYMKDPYPFVPIYSERLGTYITGQHIDPSDPSTKDNLTRKEIEEPNTAAPSKLKKFPYIIQAEIRLPLSHLRSFDITVDDRGEFVNPKDAAEFKFFSIQTDKVAPSKNKVITGEHYFYIENLEAEAQVRISNKKLRFDAEKLVREKGGLSMYRDIALMLNHKIKEFRVNLNVSEEILEDKILMACEEYPSEVIKCFSKESERDLFILKAESHGIITRKGNSFFDGSQYLGDTLEDVKKFISTQEGSRFEKRWSANLAKAENKSVVEQYTETAKERFDNLVKECSVNIVLGEIEKAKDLYQEAFTIDPTNIILEKLSESLNPKPLDTTIEGQDNTEAFEKAIRMKLQGKSRRDLVASCTGMGIDKEKYQDLSDEDLIEFIIKTKVERRS